MQNLQTIDPRELTGAAAALDHDQQSRCLENTELGVGHASTVAVPLSPILDLLREQPITRDLDPDFIQKLAMCGKIRSLTAGEYLWRQGDQSHWMYLIESGQVALEISVPRQGPLLIDVLGEGEIHGCSNWSKSARCPFDGRALTPVRCLQIDADQLNALMESNEKFGYAFLKQVAPRMAHKLDSVRLRLLEAHGLDHLRGATPTGLSS